MKKNRMMRLASTLLVLTLLTTCAVSGTFAKYTTQASGADSARVAKWGVEITANGETFATSYDKDVNPKTVASFKSEADVVAPGTSGSMVAMTLKGQPEVKVEVKYTAALDLSGWVDGSGNYYCPLAITVGGNTMSGTEYADAAAFEAAVEAAINGYTATYDPNTDLSETGKVKTPVVTWAWPFGVDDVKDTALGNAAASGNAATVILSVTTTITQVD